MFSSRHVLDISFDVEKVQLVCLDICDALRDLVQFVQF